MYAKGEGVPQNKITAASWFRAAARAAESNFTLAQYNLRVACTRVRGTQQDFPAAAGWYRRAAVRGVVPAMVNLAIVYERGQG